MNCPNCNHKIRRAEVFCPECNFLVNYNLLCLNDIIELRSFKIGNNIFRVITSKKVKKIRMVA